jgi:hypothetical protein
MVWKSQVNENERETTATNWYKILMITTEQTEAWTNKHTGNIVTATSKSLEIVF